MSEATSTTVGGPSYSLLFEVAVAVGTTVLAMFLCQHRRRNLALPSAESDNLENTKGTKQHETDKENISNKVADKTTQQNTLVEEKHHPIDSKKTTVSSNKCYASATTQTELPPMDERITWKAIVVNPWENPTRRFRSELYVDVDGVITHTESFQSEGVVGVGMKQILAKVQ